MIDECYRLITTLTCWISAQPEYNPHPKGIPMTIRICAILCFAAAISITMAAQSEPVLVSANKYCLGKRHWSPIARKSASN